MTNAYERRIELERIAFARKLDTLQRQHNDQLLFMDQTTFQIWPKPSKTWQLSSAPIAAPENMKFLSSVTLFGAVGPCLQSGKLYMIANSTDISEVKRFLILLASALKNQYSRSRPYLVMDNHSAHRSPKVQEELSRFHPTWMPPYSSPFNV